MNSAKVGVKDLVIGFVDTEGNYYPYQKALKITVNKENALINKNNAFINTKNKAYVINYGGKYSVTLTDSKGKAIAQGKVTFTLNGKKIGVVTTNKNGVATVKLTAKILKVVKAGNKKLVVKFGNDKYNTIQKTVKIKVNKEKTKIKAKKKTFKRTKKVKKYKIKLKNSKGKAIKKAKLTLKIKGKKFKAKTNAKGIAVFKIKKLTKKGNFKAKIIFNGNAYYKKVSKKVKIKIKWVCFISIIFSIFCSVLTLKIIEYRLNIFITCYFKINFNHIFV